VAKSGDYVGYLKSGSGVVVTSTLTSAVIPVENGKAYSFSGYVKQATDTVDGHRVRVLIDPGTGVFSLEATVQAVGRAPVGVWAFVDAGDVTAAGSEMRLRFFADATNPFAIGSVEWHVDDWEVSDPVTVKLAERVLSELETLFVANLGTELAAIDTDRNDGLSVPVPASANYYQRPKPELTGAETYIELFEGTLTFETDRFYEGAADGKAQYSLPVTVRATINNHNNRTSAQMLTLLRRMEVGLFNVLSKNITPWTGGEQVVSIVVSSVLPYWETAGEDEEKVIRVQSTMELTVQMEECQ